MAGKRQKAPDALVFKRAGRYQPLAVVSGTGMAAPMLPEGTRDDVRDIWRDLWTSQLAAAFKPSDVPALQRWAWWLGQWFRVASEVEDAPVVTRGANAPVLNPAIRYLKQCEGALRELERAFGMDALARLRLGITLADGQAKVAALRQPAIPEAI